MSQFDIVAIGTSAGGLKALSGLLSGLPSDLPVPILIVQHLDPRHKSLMAEILQRHCKMKVKEGMHEETMQPSTVYIAPPNKHMLVSERKIILTMTAFMHFTRPSIDLLFESVAADFGDKAIGIILTGTGIDGYQGDKRKGWNNDSAGRRDFRAFRDAATGAVDFILPDIAQAIITLFRRDQEER